MRIENTSLPINQQKSSFETLAREEAARNKPGKGDGAIPVEPDGGIGDGAGPVPIDAGGPDVTTLAIGEEDGSVPIPSEPDGGIGDGGGPIPIDADGPDVTTLAIGEEDGGGGPAPVPAPIGGNIAGTKGDDVLTGSDGDDFIRGRAGNDAISTGQGNDTVRGGRGDDTITVTGIGDKKINGGSGNDTLELKGKQSDYAIQDGRNSTIYTSPDGSRISVRNVETVNFSGGIQPPPPVDTGFQASFALEPNDLGATSLEISKGKAVLTGPDTNFTFTGVDPSGLAIDGPLIATGGAGTINGEQTTAVPLSEFGPAVLTVGSGFNLTGTQGVSAAFANGATLNTAVARADLPAQ